MLFVGTTVNDFNDAFKDKLVFNGDGKLIGESASIGENSGAYRSCSTIFHGETIIFGGNHDEPTNINRQVAIILKLSYLSHLILVNEKFFRFRLFLNVV